MKWIKIKQTTQFSNDYLNHFVLPALNLKWFLFNYTAAIRNAIECQNCPYLTFNKFPLICLSFQEAALH